MPARFRLTEDAVRDLEEAAAYLADESQTAALNLASALEHSFSFLAAWPGSGHRRPDLTSNRDVRFWFSSGYLIAYNIETRPILILGVLHGARDAAHLIDRRLEDQ